MPSFVLDRILNLMVKTQRSRWAGQGQDGGECAALEARSPVMPGMAR
jgi:hypothetical protein